MVDRKTNDKEKNDESYFQTIINVTLVIIVHSKVVIQQVINIYLCIKNEFVVMLLIYRARLHKNNVNNVLYSSKVPQSFLSIVKTSVML
jgi:hypothetical protein